MVRIPFSQHLAIRDVQVKLGIHKTKVIQAGGGSDLQLKVSQV